MKKSHKKVSAGALPIEKKLHVEGVGGGITHLSSNITMYILTTKPGA